MLTFIENELNDFEKVRSLVEQVRSLMAKARMVIEKVLTNIENVRTYFEKVQSLIAKGWRVVEKVLTNFENVLTFIANVRRLFADYLMYNAESGIKFDNIRLSLPNAVNEEQERGCLALMITLFL